MHATLWVFLAFILSCTVFYSIGDKGQIQTHLFSWINTGDLNIPMAFIIDQLSSIMMLLITGVGSLIHIYSIGYMHGDKGFNRFFAYLNLFIFFMLLLVMADNYVLMFVGWEGVGLCSWLLIGFWYQNQEYNKAANKAFIMNRIGDLAMIIAMFLIFNQFGTLIIRDVISEATVPASLHIHLGGITLLLFIAATGKSAQIPLFTWLPDAMAGPTPVSALIHAATMVTAGIYLIIRNNVLFSMTPDTMTVIMVTGIVTAIFAGSIAVKQNDIKKILAYSTVSQLGLMFFALGLGAYAAAFFHLITHAFFKALLFLGAGSIIHGLHGEQDIRKMGGLHRYMKTTHWVYFIGLLAIMAVPPFSGFFSKDGILIAAYHKSPLLWGLGLASGMLTVFYMMRSYLLVFHGDSRVEKDTMKHIHESPPVMTVPLILLSVLALLGGIINLPHIFHGNTWLQHYLTPILTEGSIHADIALEYILMGISVSAVALVSYFAYRIYIVKGAVPSENNETQGFLSQLLSSRYYVDEIYQAVSVKPFYKISAFFYNILDLKIIDGAVNGLGKLSFFISGHAKETQNGNISYYLFAMALGMGGILFLFLLF